MLQMRVLSAKNLLDAWERCLDEPAPMRGATLLAAACDETTSGETAKWSVARRDAALFELREQLFGPVVEAMVTCARCGERAELEFSLDEIRGRNLRPHPSANAGNPARTIQLDGRRIRYRAPTSEDLLAISGIADVEMARTKLLERCVGFGDSKRGGLSAAMAHRVIEHIARDQAEAQVEVKFSCPGCGHEWIALFDIAAFLWREVDDWARRMLREVHLLASRYGWREIDILSMSARRRQAYVEMLAE